MINKVLITYAKPANKEQKNSCEIVERNIRKYNFDYEVVERDLLKDRHINGKDLVIAVGGDGTFLKSAQFIKDNTLLLGVNSDVKSKEGFYMHCSKIDFEDKLKRIMKGRFNVARLLRLEAKIDGKAIDDLALNEFYFGADKSYLTSRYTLSVGNKKEYQRSSGVIIATPTGAMAWAKAAGGNTSSKSNCQFIVREPFEFNLFKDYRIKKGLIKKFDVLHIKSEMNEGIIVADSLSREYKVKYGGDIVIKISEHGISTLLK